MLRIKALHDTVQQAHGRDSWPSWNRTLERGSQEQVAELERVGRLKRFFSPQLAELIVSGRREDSCESHRREITVVFCDLRGFTAFAETAEPEEVMGVLREYHAAIGEADPRARRHAGALRRRRHDGFLQRSGACPDPAERAVRMALAMRDRVERTDRQVAQARPRAGLGIGIAQGYATIGAIGFEGRLDYGAIGTVTNLAARLCGEARPGQILVISSGSTGRSRTGGGRTGRRAWLKGFQRPVPAFSVVGLKALEPGSASGG